MKNTKKCCFTGHRPQSLPFGFNEQDERCRLLKIKLKEIILDMICNKGVNYFITGMALGIDIFAAEILIELKESNYNIIIESAIPCLEQPNKWSEESQRRYFDILSKCDKKTLIKKHYDYGCFNKRNIYMVDSSDFVIAVWSGKPSGTMKTVKYAKEIGKNITILNPVSLEIKEDY